jgi:hypothetical protein
MSREHAGTRIAEGGPSSRAAGGEADVHSNQQASYHHSEMDLGCST